MNIGIQVRLRNSAAALEAEKILWRITETTHVPRTNVVSIVDLRPETETLLRMIFRQLDSEDAGVVSAYALYQALGGSICEEKCYNFDSGGTGMESSEGSNIYFN